MDKDVAMSTQSAPKPQETSASPFHWPSALKMSGFLTLAVLVSLGSEWVTDVAFLALMIAWSVLTMYLRVRCLGTRDAVVYGSVVVVTALVFEVIGLYVLDWLAYRMHPQIAGVPLAILLGWFVGVSASFAFAAGFSASGVLPSQLLLDCLPSF